MSPAELRWAATRLRARRDDVARAVAAAIAATTGQDGPVLRGPLGTEVDTVLATLAAEARGIRRGLDAAAAELEHAAMLAERRAAAAADRHDGRRDRPGAPRQAHANRPASAGGHR